MKIINLFLALKLKKTKIYLVLKGLSQWIFRTQYVLASTYSMLTAPSVPEGMNN